MSEKPDLTIENGKVFIMGSMGYGFYEFTNNDYTYICDVDSDEDNLIVKKQNEIILSQRAKNLKR